LANYLFYL